MRTLNLAIVSDQPIRNLPPVDSSHVSAELTPGLGGSDIAPRMPMLGECKQHTPAYMQDAP